MFIDIIPLQKNTARLTRVYGDTPCAALPASVPGPEGGVLTITELGDYCFSERPRSLPGADALCRYEVGPDGTCTLVQAFGRDLTGQHGRYDLDFGEGPAAPEDLHPVCGNFVEEITLPDSLQVIGSCAFYNCRRLRRLSVGAGDLTVGSDVFLNCFALADLLVRAVRPCEQHHRGCAGTVLAPGRSASPGGAVVPRLLGGCRGKPRPHPASHLFWTGISLQAVFSGWKSPFRRI